MAFVIEDGTGLSTANAYVSVQFFKDYHKDRGNSHTSVSSEIQAAIIKASDYMDARFTFIGRRLRRDRAKDATTPAQRMEFPREYMVLPDGTVMSSETVPMEIERACAEYAIRATVVELTGEPVETSTTAVLKDASTKIGPLTITKIYQDASTTTMTFKKYPEVDKMIKDLIVPNEGAYR